MTDSTTDLKKAIAVRTEAEAAMVVQSLAAVGISAKAVGGHTAGFRAEAPGWVDVLVRESQLTAAKEILDAIHEDDEPVDWSQVDVGEPE